METSSKIGKFARIGGILLVLASLCALSCGVRITAMLKKSSELLPRIELSVPANGTPSDGADARRAALKSDVDPEDVASLAEKGTRRDSDDINEDSEDMNEPPSKGGCE